MNSSNDQSSHPSSPGSASEANTEARLGDRGAASGKNIEDARAIGQDDPMEGSRMGREATKKSGYPGTPDIGTDATQTEEAKRNDE